MISQNIVILCTMFYLAILFYIAYRGDQSRVDSYSRFQPLIYTLSITIYCTSWTYFGAVGNASISGWDYASIYLGPILVYLFLTPFLRKLVVVSKRQKTTTIADFIATRYGKSHRVAAIATFIALIGTLPYIALQIKAVADAFEQLTSTSSTAATGWLPDTALVLSIILAVFAILFGARTIDASEHHQGMMHAIAVESIVKLLAFLAISIFALLVIFDISLHSSVSPDPMSIMLSPFQEWEFSSAFFTRTLLAATAIICLPRQFHVMAVEGNGDELRTARWGFPLYLLLFTLAVIPIVAAGIQMMEGPENADLFVLSLPMIEGNTWLAMISYIGGFSAATGMVIVASIALSTMVSNDLIFPLIVRYKKHDTGKDFSGTLLLIRRMTILILLILAYGYYRLATTNTPLYSIGLLSFAAAVQFMPSIIGGLYWKGAHRDGTFWGMTAGLAIWLYTLLLPSLANTALLPDDFLKSGFFGINWLSPRALFGIHFDDYLTHGVFWSLLCNISIYIVVSLKSQASFTDKLQASAYVDQKDSQYAQPQDNKHTHFRLQDLYELCSRFTGEQHTQNFFIEHGYDLHQNPDALADQNSIKLAERLLAGSVGGASAEHLIKTATTSEKSEYELFELLGTAGEALQFNRAILQTAIDNINQGVSVVDSGLRLTAWNRTYVELFDFSDDYLQIGKPIEDVIRSTAERGLGTLAEIPEHEREEEIRRRLGYLQHGQPYNFIRHWKDGRVIQTRGARMPDGGFITTFTDITELMQAEKELEVINLNLERKVEERTEMLSAVNIELQEAKQHAEDATRSKTHFLAAASHDLTQPLSASKLYISALKEDLAIDGQTMKEQLATNALSALTTAESLLKSLLDISKLDSGSLTPDISRFPLRQIFTAIDNEFSVLAAEKGLHMKVVNTQYGTKSDLTLLRSVLQNFVSNAIRYTEHGTILLGCRRAGDDIRIEIHDTGIGIPEDKQLMIFQEFQQLNNSSEGAGLGLAICQRMAQLLGHEINVHSTPGRGSCFSITVPRCKPEMVKVETQEYQSYQKRWLEGVRILCVDDDQEILRATHTVLERWGGTITCLQDANKFDELVSSHPEFDVVLMDYRLNDEHKGLDLLKSYRSDHNHFLGIIVTAEQDRTIEEETGYLGFKYLAKPVEPARLRAILQAAFMDKKLAAEAGP